MALAFAAAGSRVAVVDLSEDKVKAVVAEMEGGPHLALAGDLRPVSGHPKLVETVVSTIGGLDVLVCAAAVLVRRPSVDEVSEADWDFQHDIRPQIDVLPLDHAVSQAFRRQGRGGRIINFTSQGWWSGGFGGSVAYAATKGGIVSMTQRVRPLAGEGQYHGQCSLARRRGYGDDAQQNNQAAVGVDRSGDPARTDGAAVGIGGRSAVSCLRPCRLRHWRDH